MTKQDLPEHARILDQFSELEIAQGRAAFEAFRANQKYYSDPTSYSHASGWYDQSYENKECWISAGEAAVKAHFETKEVNSVVDNLENLVSTFSPITEKE
jgi:hypothetical protein